jgi:hypothetical protein
MLLSLVYFVMCCLPQAPARSGRVDFRRGGRAAGPFLTGYEVTDHADYIARVSNQAGVDARTLIAILRHESRFLQAIPGTEAFEAFSAGAGGKTIGVGQMSRTTFAQTVAQHPDGRG